MASSLARLVAALGVAALAAACVAITGIDEIGVCQGDECNDAAAPPTPDASISPVNGGEPDAAIDAPIDTGTTKPDAGLPGCVSCDGGTCCAPNICRSDGTCRACGNALGTTCFADSDCCANSAQPKCNTNGSCAATCSGGDAGCAIVPGGPAGTCCTGFRCDQQLFTGRCVACAPVGAKCTKPDDCCSGNCIGELCKAG